MAFPDYSEHANWSLAEIRGSGTGRQYQFGAIARQLAEAVPWVDA
jgi:hypothetical protein